MQYTEPGRYRLPGVLDTDFFILFLEKIYTSNHLASVLCFFFFFPFSFFLF